MPQIQEYLPQQAAQEPVGGTSPNLELKGAVGRAYENLGAVVGQVGDAIHKRNVQEETTDTYATVADKRAQYTDQIQRSAQDGSLDVDKVMDSFDSDEDMQKQFDGISTNEGRNYFTRQQARLRGNLMHQASSAQAVIAASDAKASFQGAMTSTSSALISDPTNFQDAMDQGHETIDELVANGGLPEKMRGQAAQEMGREYAKSAVTGYAKVNPDFAKKLLDSGKFDTYLDGDHKEQMYREVERRRNAADVEDRRAQKAQDDAQKAKAEAWGAEALPKLTKNALSTKDVLAQVDQGTLKWEQGERWIKMINEGAKQETKTDPRQKYALIQRIVDPNHANPITGPEDLMPYVGKGLSISDFNSMNTLFNKTPEGQAVQQGEKALFQQARSTVRFKNPMTNQYDVSGEQKLGQFMNDYIQAKKTIKEKGGTLQDLVNPNSPMYFGKNINQYQTSFQDQMSGMAQDRTNKALGLPRDKDPSAATKPADKNVRQPGESASSYLKRRGLGG